MSESTANSVHTPKPDLDHIDISHVGGNAPPELKRLIADELLYQKINPNSSSDGKEVWGVSGRDVRIWGLPA